MGHEVTESQKYDETYFLFRNETLGGIAYAVLFAFFAIRGVITAPFRIFRR